MSCGWDKCKRVKVKYKTMSAAGGAGGQTQRESGARAALCCPLCSAGKHRKWEVNPHNCFLVACCVKKGLFQPSPEAGVMAGQMSTMAPFIVVPSKGMCCCDENLHPASSQASGILPGQKPTETEKNRKAPLHIKSGFFSPSIESRTKTWGRLV